MIWRIVTGVSLFWFAFWFGFTFMERGAWFSFPLFMTCGAVAIGGFALACWGASGFFEKRWRPRMQREDWAIMRWILRQ